MVGMNGRDLIIYILENGLEDTPMYEDGRLIGFMRDIEAAIKFGVGVETIRVWTVLNQLEGVIIGNQLYIPANAENPLHKGDTNVKKDDSVAVFSNNIV